MRNLREPPAFIWTSSPWAHSQEIQRNNERLRRGQQGSGYKGGGVGVAKGKVGVNLGKVEVPM